MKHGFLTLSGIIDLIILFIKSINYFVDITKSADEGGGMGALSSLFFVVKS